MFLDPKGTQWLAKHRGSSVAGITVRTDGLLAEAGVWMMKTTFPEAHRALQQWPETMTKSFAAANRVMVNA